MKNIFVVALLFFALVTSGQSSTSITTMDFVKITPGKAPEALFFYENNWLKHREMALEKGFIKAFRILETLADSIANFDLILITEYADSTQYHMREARFQQIMQVTRPDGPRLLNEVKPGAFRQNVFVKEARTLFNGGKQ
jgi:hypothetical protein